MILVALYLFAIVAANLLVAFFGPSISILNAFLFIGLDITTRDYLHEAWHRNLYLKMLALIASGSILSFLLNFNAGPIALASFVSFLLSGLVDFTSYQLLRDKSRKLKVNGSNVLSSAVDSVIFPALAFGWPLLFGIMMGQFIAKVAGGFAWYFIIERIRR